MFGLKRETPPSMAVVDRFDPLVLQSKQSLGVVGHAQPHAILQPSFWQEACFGEADAMPRARHQLRRCASLAKRREATRSDAKRREATRSLGTRQADVEGKGGLLSLEAETVRLVQRAPWATSARVAGFGPARDGSSGLPPEGSFSCPLVLLF